MGTKTETFKERVARVAEQSSGSFSFDAYSNWDAVTAMLLRRGYSDREAEAILRSKWTRWAGDAAESTRYGRHNSKDLARFIDNMIEHRGADKVAAEVADLVAGTFWGES